MTVTQWYPWFLWLCIALCSCLPLHAAATVTLSSSVGESLACPGDVVTYTCSATQVGSFRWIAEPFILDSGTTEIEYLSTDTTRIGQTVNCIDPSPTQDCADFRATLTGITNSQMMSGFTLADISSSLTVTATARLNETVVQCRGTTATEFPEDTSTVNIAGLPSPPLLQTPFYTVQEYGQDTVTVRVQWQPPLYDGGAPVDNYTITVSSGSTTTTTGTSVVLSPVPYNADYTVNIAATNCIGSSSSVMDTFRIVNCSVPTAPVNGSIETFQNTTEGAEIFFECNSGFSPPGQMRAVCPSGGMWNPDPATLVCTVDCGPPMTPRNGSLESYTNTTEGSEVFYSCNPGRVPMGRMMSTCTGNGWSPNPADTNCAVTCGAPTPPENGSIDPYQSTLEGTEILFRCNETFVPTEQMMAVCQSTGSWTPNPVDLVCTVTCGMPTPPENGSIDPYQTTLEGAEILFGCNLGFVPTGQRMAVCQSTGNWTPEPADLVCNASDVECGNPTPATGVTVESYSTTIVGSMIFYQCEQSGFTPSSLSSMCEANQTWSPDPSQVMCRMITTVPNSGGLSGGVIAAIIIVILLIVVLVGAVVIVVVVLWRKRSDVTSKRQPQLQRDDVAMYSVVDDQPVKPAPYKGYMLQGPEAEYTTIDDATSPTTSKAAEAQYDLPPGSDHPEGLVYAEVNIKGKPAAKPRPPKPAKNEDMVEYAAIAYQPKDAAEKSPPVADSKPKRMMLPDNPDDSVNLDNLLIQLKQVNAKWRELGDALGLPPSILDDISGQYQSDPQQCMVEMLDSWLMRHMHQGSPTWWEVALALRETNHDEMADALETVYTTGVLPITVNMDEIPVGSLPEDTSSPPPIPVRGPLTDEPDYPPPKPPRSTPEKKAAPPRPHKPRPEPSVPPRPPRAH